jgi:sialate O-acetylesterase
MDFVVSGDMAKYPGMAQRFAGVVNEAEEIAAANCPKIREFRVPLKLSELPLEDVAGKWQVCTPATVPGFSAIGYFLSRNLQKAINQPIGFITSAFGASCAQAWVSKDVLESDARLKGIMDGFATQVAAFKSAAADNPAPPPGARGGRGNPLTNQHNPYVLWNAMIKPIQPYAIKGVLWYQGESITGVYAGRAGSDTPKGT